MRALLAAGLLAGVGTAASVAPVLTAPASGWHNSNGTATGAAGHATTDGAQPAKVFAFATDNPVSGCTSPQGTCSVGQPDGANSFEVFDSSATATVTFTVTTSVPIACDFTMPFKASFSGVLPYYPQTAVTTENTCSGPPPTACPVTDLRGYFEPTQAVWQDDPNTARFHFDDKPGKQLTQTSPTSYVAELPMIQDKPTLLFGIDHAQNALAEAPHDRWNIVIRGTTYGDTLVPVKMKFTGHGAGATLDYTTDVFDSIYLDGVCGEARPFAASLPAALGMPSPTGAAFTFTGTGAYTLTDELVRADGIGTGLQVKVTGSVVRTHGPITYFVPVVMTGTGGSAAATRLQAQSETLRDQVVLNTPDYYPLKPGGFLGFNEPLIDVSAQVKADLKTWSTWASSLVLGSGIVHRDALLASLTDAFELGAILGKVGRTVVVLSPHDMDAIGKSSADGYAESGKVVFVRSTVKHFTVAHEIAHTMPYLWSVANMLAQCGIAYHNKTIEVAHGYRVTAGGVDSRASRDPSASFMSNSAFPWADQCTYWNLIDQLQNPSDPLVLLVRGRLGMHGTRVIGQLFAPYRLSSAPDLAPGTGGTWAIVARSASGAILARYPFSPQWAGEDRTRSIISFAYRIPATPGIARLDLVGPGGLLSRLVASAHAPTVAITAPSGRTRLAPIGGSIHVTWRGHDADGNRLLYTVLYSSDGGNTWLAESVEQPGTSFDVQLSSGTSHRVKIVVTDGARSAQASVAFATR